jgi:peptidoglycan DL-endopeptidase CwlO
VRFVSLALAQTVFSSMSTRLRTRLLTFCAFAALAGGAAGPAGAWVDEGTRGPNAPVPDTRAERAVEFALQAVGTPYRWGGESPAYGFDCSGLVRWAYSQVGLDLPHSSYALYGEGRRVSESKMEPGDILFFEGLGHVGLYLGRGRMVHAPQTGRNVEIVRLASTNYGFRLIGARRVA